MKKWADLRKGKMTDAQLAALDRKVDLAVLTINLRELRKIAGKTQADVAVVLNTSQGQLSVTERRRDHRVSTLKEYVKALGGELHLVADFGDRQFCLRPFKAGDVEVQIEAPPPPRPIRSRRLANARR